MLDPVAHILAYPDLSSEEMAELRSAIEADAVVAALFECRKEIAAAIRADIPLRPSPADDRDVFALFSLYRSGRAGDLTADESALVAEHVDGLEAALTRHPGLAAASADLGDAASEFSALWDAHFESRGPTRGQRAPDRRSTAPTPRRGAYRWAVRAAIAAAVVAFAFVLTQVTGRDNDMVAVETAQGETRLVEIGDGSRAWLMESTTLSYADPKSSLMRRAELSGRAFFEIAPADRGFILETSVARVTVLGTTFAVNAQEGETEVVLTGGRLTLSRSEKLDDLVVLEPGQMSRIVAGAGPTTPSAIDVSRTLSWTGLFIFQSTPLHEIATLLSDHFDVRISVDEAFRDERVTGTFDRKQPLPQILGTIAAAVGAAVQPDAAGGYVVTHP